MALPDAKSFEVLPAGTYKVFLAGWEEREFPSFDNKSVMEVRILWKFEEEQSGQWITTITSTARSGRSKMRPLLLALNGGKELEQSVLMEGARLEAWINSQIGREVLANVSVTKDGQYNRIEGLMAVPGGGRLRQMAKGDTTKTDTDDHGNIKFA